MNARIWWCDSDRTWKPACEFIVYGAQDVVQSRSRPSIRSTA
jgi:hypothetical protein